VTISSRFILHSGGTRINYLSLGSGPAVIVVPGVLSAAEDYIAFAMALASNFTVHILERRGRGLSSPQDDSYRIASEADDVLALQQETGSALWVGHSYGGLIVLEAARQNSTVAALSLYEPTVSVEGAIDLDWLPSYQEKLARHRNLDAFVEFSVGAGPAFARRMPRSLMKLLLPLFVTRHELKQALALLRQNAKEHQEIRRLDNAYPHYAEVSAAVLLMYGARNQLAWVEQANQRLATVLPRMEIREFPSLGHFGINKQAPTLVAQVIQEFFRRFTSAGARPADSKRESWLACP
jgi:pimeloyl-ACP methyl ester carboxylesterase